MAELSPIAPGEPDHGADPRRRGHAGGVQAAAHGLPAGRHAEGPSGGDQVWPSARLPLKHLPKGEGGAAECEIASTLTAETVILLHPTLLLAGVSTVIYT